MYIAVRRFRRPFLGSISNVAQAAMKPTSMRPLVIKRVVKGQHFTRPFAIRQSVIRPSGISQQMIGRVNQFGLISRELHMYARPAKCRFLSTKLPKSDETPVKVEKISSQSFKDTSDTFAVILYIYMVGLWIGLFISFVCALALPFASKSVIEDWSSQGVEDAQFTLISYGIIISISWPASLSFLITRKIAE